MSSKITLEPFIVFVAVSAAFAVANLRDEQAKAERRQVVYRALDRELKQMAETDGPMLQRQLSAQLDALDKAIAEAKKPLPPGFRLADAERPPTGVWDASAPGKAIKPAAPAFSGKR